VWTINHHRQTNEVAMIRFACPTCQKILQAPAGQSGQKVACPGCGQRLQIPAPPRNKTVLASFVPENDARARQETAPLATSPGQSASEGEGDATWFYVHSGQRNGPVSFAQLRLVAATKLDPSALVWNTGMADWVAAGTVAGLSFRQRSKGKARKAVACLGGLVAVAAGVAAIFFGLRDLDVLQASSDSSGTSSRQIASNDKDGNGGRSTRSSSENRTPKREARSDRKPDDQKSRSDESQEVVLKKRAVAATQLKAAAKEYADHLGKSAKVLDDALKQEADASQALIKFRLQIASALKRQAVVMNELTAVLNDLTADQNLPRESVTGLTEVHHKCVEMRDLLEGKGLDRYTPKTYIEKVESLNRECADLVAKL
jgi:hypothetical protein